MEVAVELVDAISSGDRRTALEAIRDKLAAELAGASGRDAAPLTKELSRVMVELDNIPTGREESAVDDLAAARARRLAGAADLERPTASE